MGEAVVTISLQGDVLKMEVPGQPVYTLEPYKDTEFRLKDLEGYSVAFVLEGGKVIEMKAVQPNGTFTLKRIEKY
jgi:hypothetical protein